LILHLIPLLISYVKLHAFLTLVLQRWVVSFLLWPLYPWRKTPIPLDGRLGGPQSQYECSGKDEKSFPHWKSNLIHQACNLFTTV